MTKDELIQAIADAIEHEEGFHVTEEQAKDRRIKWPTLAQRQANPGNIRRWKDARKKVYPTRNGYVDFLAWAREKHPKTTDESKLMQVALEEGGRVLRVLVGQYVDGRYTGKESPTLKQMFAVYAPESDRNDPKSYARHVAYRTGLPLNVALKDLIDA